MNRTSFVTIALSSALCGTATTASATQISVVGPWRVLSGQSSSGSYCTMQLGQIEKVFGLQVRVDGRSFVTLADPDWAFTPQTRLPIKITIDGTLKLEGEAIAVLPNTLVLPVAGTADQAAAVAAGKSLVAAVGNSSLTFDLAGAAAARDALQSCLAAAKTP